MTACFEHHNVCPERTDCEWRPLRDRARLLMRKMSDPEDLTPKTAAASGRVIRAQGVDDVCRLGRLAKGSQAARVRISSLCAPSLNNDRAFVRPIFSRSASLMLAESNQIAA